MFFLTQNAGPNNLPNATVPTGGAVLVDCDNTSPDILDYALRVVAQFGRVVLRRGYGNHATLSNKWQEALVRLAFTPCLQYQYAAGKNTSDIALALDALEALFDHRAETFCLVTSDSDFAYLCRKLRERGATVHIVGEAKSPDALRNASDQFFEWAPPVDPASPTATTTIKAGATARAKQRPNLWPMLFSCSQQIRLMAAYMLADWDRICGGPTRRFLPKPTVTLAWSTCSRPTICSALQQEPGGHWMVAHAAPSDVAKNPKSTATDDR